MKPDDKNGWLPTADRPVRILIVAGSGRRQYNCPGVDSKARTLMLRLASALPQDWEIDYEDLGNVFARPKIQSCNACASTSMALCCWPCNCYAKDDRKEPDFMWDADMYARLDLADAWAIIGPINWFGPSSNLKLMFDRLVCASGGNPKEALIDHKDPEKAMALEKSPQWRALSQNHLEGRTAAFFCYGDEGANETGEDGRPKALRHREWYDPRRDELEDEREAYGALVRQCRYSGIEVPEPLWRHVSFGVGKPYADDQAEDMMRDSEGIAAFDRWCGDFAAFVRRKGKVPPNEFRAFGYRAPGHFTADMRLKWREWRMRLGLPPAQSSPARQQNDKLNDDATLRPARSEGEKLRS